MNQIQELIHRRRRQVLIHSILYYQFNTNTVPDVQFDLWAQELAKLQADHPEDSEAVEYHREAFRGFTGETGFDLPLWDRQAQSVAQKIRLTFEQGEGKV